MRFITEFENTPALLLEEGYNSWVKTYEARGELDIATQIGNSFGWETDEQPFKIRHTLEIEAFPVDKWVEFKQKLYELFHKNGLILSGGVLEHMLRDLESFGKPSGDAITNLPDLEYRGPGSHCKACEDEKAGIKHIQSQRHTCKK